MAGEEVFQFEDAFGRMHVFLSSHTGDGGLVHVDRLGDVMQH